MPDLLRILTHQNSTRFACEVKNFDPSNYFERKEVRKVDVYAQYAVAAAKEAIENSGIDLDKINRDEVGVIMAPESVEF